LIEVYQDSNRINNFIPQRLKDSKNHKGSFEPITEEFEEIGRLIVDSAYSVHSNLGPGLLEKVYGYMF
jgi:hypothetical protein